MRSCCKALQSFIGMAGVACRELWCVWYPECVVCVVPSMPSCRPTREKKTSFNGFGLSEVG